MKLEPPPKQSTERKSLGQIALGGSALTAAQVVLNKLLASVATICLGQFLTPDEFGLAGVAISIGATCILFQTWVFVDVSIAEAPNAARLLRPTQVGALLFGAGQALAILAAAPILQRALPDKQGLWVLMCIVAFRPLSDAMSVAPLAHLRIGLSFRSLVWIDGITAAAGSVASVLLAMLGFGAMSIVLPPIATLAVRALAYWLVARPPMETRLHWADVRHVCRRFVGASIGAYLTSVTYLVDALLLGMFVTERSIGLYAFSFNLAIQATVVIAQNVAGSVQPVFAAMAGDLRRQSEGLLRTVRLVSIVTVPASLIQAAFAIPLFEALWGDKWNAALPVFMVLSIGQALVFVGTPSIYLLKAQGRFRGYLKLEAIHLAFSIAATLASIRWGGAAVARLADAIGVDVDADAAVPLAVSVATASAWALFGPLSMLLACKGSRVGAIQVLDVMLRPWIVSVPLAVGGAWASILLLPSIVDRIAKVGVVGLFVAITFVVSVWVGSLLYPSTRSDLRALLVRFVPRFRSSASR